MKKTAFAIAATLCLSHAAFAAQDAPQFGADAWGATAPAAAPLFAVADPKIATRDAQEQKDAARVLAEKNKGGVRTVSDGVALGGRSAVGGAAARVAHSTPILGPCENMPAQWAAAEKMARGGQADAALSVYAHLLAACPSPKIAEGTAWKAVGALPKEQRDLLIDGPALKTQELSAIRSQLLLARMTEERKAGQFKAALADSRTIRSDIIASGDAGALESSAWLEEQAQNSAEAQKLFRLAVAAAKTPESAQSAQMGLALSFMKDGKLDEALDAASSVPTADALRLAGSIWLIQAQAASNAGNGAEALRLLDQAALAGVPVGDTEQATRGWALLKMGRAKEAQATFAALRVDTQKPETQTEARDGFIYAALETRDYGALKDVIREPAPVFSAPEGSENPNPMAAESQNARKMAQDAVAGHYDRMGYFGAAQAARGVPAEGLGASVQAMASYENKSGAQGQDKLRIATVPQLSVVLPSTSLMQARVDAYGLRLDNGLRHAWGEGATVSAARQLDVGVVGGSLGVENPGQGTTQVLGSARYQWASGSEQEFVHATGSREAVLDSLRSFEGDAAAGIGPATSNKGEIEGRARVFADDVFVQGSFTGGAVTARGTPFNPFYAVGVSLTRDFAAHGWSWLNGGVDLRGGSSRYDANRFDEKVGGYWSPKSNREAGVVFNAQSAEDKQWLFKTSMRTGYASRELYTGHASGAFGEGTAQVAALVSQQVILGAGIGGRASPGYHDTNVFAWVKIPFGARAHLTAADLAAPRGF